ncbi:response regulator [Ferruginibacter paludis]|uniref:response regulator n=1 Tax=Ferruginibacter paludis TaxID=1310417 RepID=UPI0025B3A556|nr:response regulator [Ferruginibacter paludis]MDN3656235.1 response regulator [Ferruginibacter paludis]
MQLSLKRNLMIGFGISLLILIGSSVASYISITNLLKSADMVNHTNTVVAKLEQTISVMKDAETGQRGFLLTGKDEFLQPYSGSYEKVLELIKDIKGLTADNAAQQEKISVLDQVIKKRFYRLQALIDEKKANKPLALDDLQAGRFFMDSVRGMIKNMTTEENKLLKSRTENLVKFSSNTPVMITVAAMLAIIITILFYLKTNKDITIRTKLQDELVKKDAAISHRINMIQRVSEKISGGDYSIRVNDVEVDELGNLSGALNKMAASLERSFNELADKEWLQTGIASLNEAVIGDDNMQSIAQKIMACIAEYTNSQVGAFYIRESEQQLSLENSYALQENAAKQKIKTGEGLAGQCALSKKQLMVTNIADDNFHISFAAAKVKPVCLVVFPALFENNVNAVIELGALHTYTSRELDFFKQISGNIGIAINTVQNRQRLQELLEETQSQSEELMSQQSELEQINSELELQTQQLQTSEEELKVQSEELIETNTLLEERSAALEQRNQLIMQKNAEIEKKAADLALSTKYKSEFLANMSHELRTPLNSILLLSRLMSENNEQNLTADQVQYAHVIESSGKGLLQLIDEILDLSKIESGKMTIEYLPVKINEVTDGLNALFSPLAKEHQLEWEIKVGAEVPAIIETDKMRLEQVLKNLLSNAFKFTSKGAVHLNVSMDTHRPGFICFVVKDTGIGISPEKQELIFEAFQQEDGSTRRKYGGTGLGLSISRELSRLLGGEITVSSTPGSGSEFVCCIPVEKGKNFTDIINAEQPVATRPEIQPFASEKKKSADDRYNTNVIPEEIPDDRNNITSSDKVILIIEDDVTFAEALLGYARKKGYKGLVAVRGDVGIAMAEQYLPSGILLDIQLPVKNGWEVMDTLKHNIHTRHIPVHIMSSYEVRKESLLKGAVNFINKPVAFEQLNTIFEKIEFILSKKENKVLIIEENNKHAKALAYYLGTYNVNTTINQSVNESIVSLHKKEVDCVILDMSITDNNTDALLEKIRENDGLEDLPIILFTGKSLSQPEEFKIKKYADAIVLKTANSYQRILDEVTLFLHQVQEQQNKPATANFERSVLKENVLKGKKVLLADDDVRNIYSMTKALEKYQMNVIPAMDGKEALHLSKINEVDVILMDMMMPEMDGYDSIRAIRKNPVYKNTPIIAVTAKAMGGDREKCIAAGASDYISKPVDTDQLVSLLRIWLYEKGY